MVDVNNHFKCLYTSIKKTNCWSELKNKYEIVSVR